MNENGKIAEQLYGGSRDLRALFQV